MKRNKSRVTAIVIIVIIVAIIACAAWAMWTNYSQTKEPVEITILHTNDIHANVSETDKGVIGFAKIAAYINEIREQDKNVLVLDAGDMFQGLPFANLEKGHSVIDIVNLVGYDAMTVGNHEFDFGADNLFAIADKLNYPFIAANIYKADGTRAFEPYITKDIDGVKVGIFGIATPETAFKTHPANVAGYTFTDIIEEAQKCVNELRENEKADVIIMIGHLGLYEGEYTSDLVAKNVEGIDVIIDGHSHTALPEGLLEGNTLIASTGTALNSLGEIQLTVEDGNVVQKSAVLLSSDSFADIVPDAEILAKIDEVSTNQEEALSEVIGETAINLEGTREIVRTSETNLGQLIADAMLKLTDADIAIMNGGGIRASIETGPVTMKEIITVLPFGNTIMVKEVKGSDIIAALEHGVSEYPNEKGGFLHVSGITFTFDPSQSTGKRISEVKIDGKNIDTNAIYTVAMPDFIAAGGDDFTMFTQYPIKAEYNTLMDTFAEYIRGLGTVNGDFKARIKVINESTPNVAA